MLAVSQLQMRILRFVKPRSRKSSKRTKTQRRILRCTQVNLFSQPWKHHCFIVKWTCPHCACQYKTSHANTKLHTPTRNYTHHNKTTHTNIKLHRTVYLQNVHGIKKINNLLCVQYMCFLSLLHDSFPSNNYMSTCPFCCQDELVSHDGHLFGDNGWIMFENLQQDVDDLTPSRTFRPDD